MVALVLFSLFEPEHTKRASNALAQIFGSANSELSGLGFVVCSYVIGHLLSPATKFVQYVSERYPKIKPSRSAGTPRPRTFKEKELLSLKTPVVGSSLIPMTNEVKSNRTRRTTIGFV